MPSVSSVVTEGDKAVVVSLGADPSDGAQVRRA